MKTAEVNDSIIGQRCKSIFTGLMVTGVIEEIKIGEHTAEVKVRYDKPHQWGNVSYESDWSFGRLADEFGSLRHLEIIDNKYQTVKVIFSEPIEDIERMFTRDYANWQTVNLKEWIDNYETSRFTQINDRIAIITSEINMDCIKEWLTRNTPLQIIETLN